MRSLPLLHHINFATITRPNQAQSDIRQFSDHALASQNQALDDPTQGPDSLHHDEPCDRSCPPTEIECSDLDHSDVHHTQQEGNSTISSGGAAVGSYERRLKQ